jgi:hypothetical protein
MSRRPLAVLLLVATSTALAQEPGRFQLVATYRGQGGQFASTVAPGPDPASDRIYATYLYLENTFDVISVDPNTGDTKVYSNPVTGEYGARSVVTGPDGNVYLGTLPNAHLLKLETKTGKLVDLGRPSPSEQFIWDVTFGQDGKLYGGTYPNAKLVRYDPKTGALEDLGRMDSVEEYAHFLAPSSDGFIYGGIGTHKMNIAAYHIATGERREILPAKFQEVGQANVYRAADGRVYAVAGKQYFRLDGWNATPIEASAAGPRVYPNRARDGRILMLGRDALTVTEPKTGKTTRVGFAYPGRELPVFRVALGPDNVLYASSVLPARLLRLDEEHGQFTELGELGGGEVYSFLARGDRLLMAAYGCAAPLMIFDPSKPFRKDPPSSNPALVNYAGSDLSWRPLAMLNGPDGLVYAGAVAGYGKLGGPLCSWNVDAGSVQQNMHVLTDQSVSALTLWKSRIIGGTTINGGGGSRPTRKEGMVFLWDPVSRKVVFSFVPVPGAATIDNLITAPNGLVYGLAGSKLFILDAEKPQVRLRKDLPFPGGTVYSSLVFGPDGRIWGLAGHPNAGIFAIDPRTNDVRLVARPPKTITGGFAFKNNAIYFLSGPDLYRFVLRGNPNQPMR